MIRLVADYVATRERRTPNRLPGGWPNATPSLVAYGRHIEARAFADLEPGYTTRSSQRV